MKDMCHVSMTDQLHIERKEMKPNCGLKC